MKIEAGARVLWTGKDPMKGEVLEDGTIKWQDGTFCPSDRIDPEFVKIDCDCPDWPGEGGAPTRRKAHRRDCPAE